MKDKKITDWFAVGVQLKMNGWRSPHDFLLAATFRGAFIRPSNFAELERGFNNGKVVRGT